MNPDSPFQRSPTLTAHSAPAAARPPTSLHATSAGADAKREREREREREKAMGGKFRGRERE